MLAYLGRLSCLGEFFFFLASSNIGGVPNEMKCGDAVWILIQTNLLQKRNLNLRDGGRKDLTMYCILDHAKKLSLIY